jgi:hypothetical protein
MEKAVAVYSLHPKNFKMERHYSHGSSDGVRKALDSHTGNAGDINIALVSRIKFCRGLKPRPLLSTPVQMAW